MFGISIIVMTLSIVFSCSEAFAPSRAPSAKKHYMGGQVFEEVRTKIEPDFVFKHIGDIPSDNDIDPTELRRQREYNMNVGRALEVLRRELPMVFVHSDLNFGIFSPQIIVDDGNNHKMVMQKSLYSAAVKSLRLASSFSSMYPSMNLKKIEYLEESSTIQCLVDVVLPDSVRIDGQAVWEGMFYFGLDAQGYISSHIFDRKISTMKPSSLNVKAYPWMRAGPKWSSDLVNGMPVPQRGLVSASAIVESNVIDLPPN